MGNEAKKLTEGFTREFLVWLHGDVPGLPTCLVEAYMRSVATQEKFNSFNSPGLMASTPHYSVTMPPHYRVKNKIAYLEELLWWAQ